MLTGQILNTFNSKILNMRFAALLVVILFLDYMDI